MSRGWYGPEHADELWRNLDFLNKSQDIAMVIATKVPPEEPVLKAQQLVLTRRETVSPTSL